MNNSNYPKYQCHKEVSAAKITGVEHGADGSLKLHLAGGFDNVVFSHEEMKRLQKPETGWWLIVYADGYRSFSPGKAFEQGYTPIGAGGGKPGVGDNVVAVSGLPGQNSSLTGGDEKQSSTGTTANGSEFGRRRGDAGEGTEEAAGEEAGELDEVAANATG